MAHLINVVELSAVVDNLELDEKLKDRIKNRWLKYLERWDDRAAKNKWKHYTMRAIVVVGGVLLPALVGTVAIPSLSNLNEIGENAVQRVAFCLSLIVGVAAALEGVFRFGEIWRDKRAAGEVLHCEGWRYIQLVGKYKGMTHKDAFPDFASTVEDIIEHEIKDYLLVTRPKEEEKQ